MLGFASWRNDNLWSMSDQVLPISFYEVDGNAYYNSIAIIDADGTVLGVYRKTHIPESPGYLEKFYFTVSCLHRL